MSVTITGLGLMGLGLAFVYASNLVFYKIQEDLTEKFPERMDWILGNSTRETFAFNKTGRLYQMHAEVFPASSRRSKSISLFVVGVLIAVTGFGVLAIFR